MSETATHEKFKQGFRDALKVADQAIGAMTSGPKIRGLPEAEWAAYWRGARAARAEIEVRREAIRA